MNTETRLYPELKGTDKVRVDCGWCIEGVYTGPSRVTWENGKGVTTWCFRCNGAGFRMVKVSSLRAAARRQEAARVEAEAAAEAYAARMEAEREEREAAEAVRAAEQAAKVDASQHLGAVGDKLTLVVTLTKRFTFDGTYGPSYLWIMTTAEGQAVTCYSSAQAMFDWEDRGGIATVTATVKAHTERDGIRQTQIVRPKVTA